MAEPSKEAVFSPATLMLGEIHWHLLRAYQLMDEKTSVKTQRAGFVMYQGQTEFGNEVGRDEIDWWIFRKEPDIQELGRETKVALEAAQELKKASELLKTKDPETHAGLLAILLKFADDHAGEIDAIHRFVRWLVARDTLAATILYTYRVWGTTRRGERDFRLDLTETEPKSETVRSLAEIVLGLSSNQFPVMFRAEYELGAEIYEHLNPEELAEDAEIKIPMSRIVRRASRLAFDDCAEYFEFIRDSLRNILLDIEKFIEQRNFVNDDAFWRAFIEKATATAKAEPQLWDFKETLTMWHVDLLRRCSEFRQYPWGSLDSRRH